MRNALRLLCVLSAIPAVAAAQAPAPDPPAIVTRGEGTIKRAPDQAFVSIAAESRASTPAEAQRLGAEAMTSARAALTKAGVTADAIKTTGYSLNPDMEWVNGRSRVRGYIARNQIEVRVDALDKLGAVLDAAGSSGATSIAGLHFDLKDRAVVERDALRLAVEDAMARARAIAAGAKATLGPILRIEDQVETYKPTPVPMQMQMRAGMEAAAPQTPVSPGEIEIIARVTVSVRIN
jgi:uncharacterized protein YggE